MPFAEITPEQRAAGLEKASRTRTERARIKEALKKGETTLAEVLVKGTEDPVIGGIKVMQLLTALPGTGRVKARAAMEYVVIAENRRVSGLTPRQRNDLIEEFTPAHH